MDIKEQELKVSSLINGMIQDYIAFIENDVNEITDKKWCDTVTEYAGLLKKAVKVHERLQAKVYDFKQKIR